MIEPEILEEKKEILNFKVDLINKRHQPGSLIPLLQSAQNSYGYIPEKVIDYISELVGIPPAEIYGVITFYARFRLKPIGKNLIRICEGTACHVNGAKRVLSILEDEIGISIGETTDDGLFSLLSVACLGCCSLAPVMMIGEQTYGKLTGNESVKIIKNIRIAESN